MGSSTGTLLVPDDATLAAVLRNGTRRVSVHSEDEARLRERKSIAEKSGDVRDHPNWRDAGTALCATERLLRAARSFGRKVHVLHTTTAEEIDLLAKNKDIATVEVTPQHLTLVAPDCYDRLGTLAQMNPPIRDAHHRAALWRGIADGTVDVIGSDHAPHTREEKAKRYPASPSGMPGVQTLVPLLLDHVAAGRLDLRRMVELTSTGAARLWGLRGKGALAVGSAADFTIVDRKARRTITNQWIASRCGWTPFDGMTVTGWPTATVIRGAIVMRDDEVLGTPQGRPLTFAETSR
jgi:dihydroorotase